MSQSESFQDRMIRQYCRGLSFIDVGGLWGTLNEKVSVASLAGAKLTAIADMQDFSSDLWQKFRDRCTGLGVTGYREFNANLDDGKFSDTVGRYDFVHCSGIIYHAPSPLYAIAQLRSITVRFLLIGSMVVPEKVGNEVGSIDFGGGMMLFLPGMSDEKRAVMARYFDVSGIKIAHVNANWSDPHWVNGSVNYSPWWWLYSATTLRSMLKVSGFKVLSQGPYWGDRVSYCLCERTY